MLFKKVFASTALAIGVLATPAPWAEHKLARDAAVGPTVGSGYSAQAVEQIHQAHLDAVKLAFTAVDSANDEHFDRIFTKYFTIKDKSFVINVLNQIVINADAPTDGNRLLSQINVVPDYDDGITKGTACSDGKRYGQLRHWTEQNPSLVICPRGFKHGSFDGPKWLGVQAIDCNSIGSRVSWRMMTLGHIFLQKYTYYKNIEAEAFNGYFGYANDLADGPIAVQSLPWYKSRQNGDSYAWFATELMWTLHCGREFDKPIKGDDVDPN